VVEDSALVSSGPVGADDVSSISLTSSEISVYTVREGDTLSMIAEMFGVTANTILWANDLRSATAIRPGDTLIILPIPGVQYRVKKGDTVASIAKTYGGDADEIRSYNQLGDDALAVGSTIIIPGGTMPAPTRPASSGTRSAGTSSTGAGSAAGLTHPLPGALRTQGLHGFNAVDLAAPVGTPIRAAAAGEVIVAKTGGWNGGYGNYIVIRHNSGIQTLYSHNDSNAVAVGDRVSAGQVIGYVGNTGRSTGPHLHFEVRGARNPF
jgi:murein DD-endopeptidase MepM/ murein hydrolase activator NlpD